MVRRVQLSKLLNSISREDAILFLNLYPSSMGDIYVYLLNKLIFHLLLMLMVEKRV